MIAAAIPVRVAGRMTPRTISQRVAPSASAPSSSSFGTCRNSSRQMLAMIGTIMIVRITPAVNRPGAGRPIGAPKIGRKPEVVVQPRLDVLREERAEHEDSPEPEHDARDRREHLDQRADDCRARRAARARSARARSRSPAASRSRARSAS